MLEGFVDCHTLLGIKGLKDDVENSVIYNVSELTKVFERKSIASVEACGNRVGKGRFLRIGSARM